MSTESTPFKENFKCHLKDLLAGITPVKLSNFLLEEKNNSFSGKRKADSGANNENEDVLESARCPQMHKFRRRKLDVELRKSQTCSPVISDSLIIENPDAYKNHFDKDVEFQDSVIDALLIRLKDDLQSSDKTGDRGVRNYSLNETVVEKNELHESGSLYKELSSEPVNEVLTVSDVMKWSNDSFNPHSKFDLSHQIKSKLFENVNSKEIIKSQASGWTQLNCDDQINGKSCDHQEIASFYGLPFYVKRLYEELKGIKQLYSWQQKCLNLEAVRLHKNLVYTLPTSGGKTLVAELLILKEILCYNKNVLFILPFVSLVQEKMRDFSQLALELGFLVEEYAAGKGAVPPRKRRKKNSLFIATIEKALVLVHSLIELKRLGELGLIVVDELHLLSEEGRGAVLETLLTQILYVEEKIQIIGMTATIGNLEEVAKFLKAESYSGNFRPVHLSEYIKCGNKIFKIDCASEDFLKEVKTLTPAKEVDPDGITQLVQDMIPNDSVLIFCATKKNCENVAILLCRILSRDLMKIKEREKMSLYRALVSESNDQICPVLRKTIPLGIAYHHSGLTAGERKLLEEAFRDGTLSVICCTSTLAAGVNLPAKRVILRSPYVGKDFISLSKYKQMVGRAGRSGFGSTGESYLMCQPEDWEKVKQLFRSPMDEATSKLDSNACKDLILSAIGLGTATTRRTLRELLGHSLLHIQSSKLNEDTDKMTDACISSLYKQGALKVRSCDSGCTSGDNSRSKLDLNETQGKRSLKITSDTPLMVSRLGRAAMKGGLNLEKAHELYCDLVKAQGSLVLLTNLHLLYLVTPRDLIIQINPNFSTFFNVYMQLDSKEVHTAKIIGVTEFVVSKLAVGVKPKNIQESVLNRFYISLILNELWKQQTVWDVASLFQLPRGLVQTIMTSSSTFANSVLRFCEELEELWSFKSLLTEFAPRLAHCCAPALLPLMDLPAVKRGRAKQLYDAGFKTLQSVAVAQPADLIRCVDHLSTKAATQMVATAKLLILEKAENLKEEAEDVLEGLAEKSAPADV